MIYTSNFARKGMDPNAFSIAFSAQAAHFTGKSIPEFAPTWKMVEGFKRGMISEHRYSHDYKELLLGRDIDFVGILDALPDPAYLLCYEPVGQFCHRRVFAELMEEYFDMVIPEWQSEKEKRIVQQKGFVDMMVEY